MATNRIKVAAFSLMLCLGIAVAQADTNSAPSVQDSAFALNPLFTDHMVLQRERLVPVFGRARPRETVSVDFAGQHKSVQADAQGQWKVTLDPLQASTEPRALVAQFSETKTTVKREDVLVGDVWLCGGQSNMQSQMRYYKTLAPRIPETVNSLVRLFNFKLGGIGTNTPSDAVIIEPRCKDSWQRSSPEFAREFSATAIFFAQALQPRLGIPIGLISANRGASPVSAWIPRSAMDGNPAFDRVLNRNNPNLVATKRTPNTENAPTFLYNGTIHPLRQFAIKGVIWYQGESDSEHPETYAGQFKTLIGSWRAAWGYDFPFLLVQLAGLGNESVNLKWDKSGEAWAWQREAQAQGLTLPHTSMAVAYDLGEAGDIHPQNKEPVGQRLALLAERLERPATLARGPAFKSVRFEGKVARVSFVANTADGLQTKRLALNKNPGLLPGTDPEALVVPKEKLAGFTICGPDHKFFKADARIEGNEVLVSHPQITEPQAVRYAWSNLPLANLYNGSGLPAEPFRTDHLAQPDFINTLPTAPYLTVSNAPGTAMALKPDGKSSRNVLTNEAGQSCWRNLTTGDPIRYMLVKNTAVDLGQGRCPKLELAIVYLDRDYLDLVVRYDSSDEAVQDGSNKPGAFKEAGIVRLNNTGTWRVAHFQLPDAYFGGRCGGGDIRFQVNGDFDFYIKGVYAQPATK